MNEVEAAWKELEAEAEHVPGSGVLVRRLAPDGVGDIRVGIEQPGAVRTLFVSVPRGTLNRAAMQLGCAGIDAKVYALNASDRENVDVGVRLTNERFGDLFGALAQDLVTYIAAVATATDVAPALFGRLARWQQFLKRLAPDGLGAEAQRGLYGELLFLKRVLIPTLGGVSALNAWTGPQGTDQDFQSGDRRAIEVKTAAGHQLQVLEIASERQLDLIGLDVLLIYFASLDVRSGSGETLPEAIAAMRTLIDLTHGAREVFEACILEAGYLDVHAPRYAGVGYDLRRTAFFRVTDAFPRITETMLPQGIGNVRYAVSVAECEHHLIPDDAAIALLRDGGQ